MKQVLFRSGKASVEDVPAPWPGPGQVLVRVAWSCVSPGTELATAARTGTGGIVEQLRRNPAKIRKAFEVLQQRGLKSFGTIARERITAAGSAGYSCAGMVLGAGEGVDGFAVGDRVACAGDQYAKHAEAVAVPVNLIVRLPDGVDMADACTVTLGAIAMQGVRRAQAALGERIGVIGLGFLGQLTVQILKSAGCKVFGTDLDPARVADAKSLGLDGTPESGGDPLAAAHRFTEGYGLDAVLITAATKSNEPLHLAMQMARKKGRVVVVGDIGLGARREAMYAKELDLLISTSYGPGRYDPSYEEEGLDYPYAYVRWTENRNMQAYLELLAAGKVDLAPLTKRRLPVSEAPEAYRLLREGSPKPYTVLLEYPAAETAPLAHRLTVRETSRVKEGVVKLALLGAGSFARSVHIPNLQKQSSRFHIEAVVTRSGPMAVTIARQVSARTAATDYREIIADPSIDAVLIATRHDLHARMVEEALRAGKHVFVEKPLALTEDDLNSLDALVQSLQNSPAGTPVVFVGFNRRYSPYAVKLRELTANRSTPLHLVYRMNAGYLPPEHWVHGPEGGGRLLGEACHILDLFRFLTGAPAVEVRATAIRSRRRDVSPSDNFTATVRYADGSVCTLLYTAQGGKELPKEALELHVDGQTFVLDDYKTLTCYGSSARLQTRVQEKGHPEELTAFHQAIRGTLDRNCLWQEAVEITRTTLVLDNQVRHATV